MIRLLAVDLDDTLLNRHLAISSRNREALRRAREQGVHITLATGRMYCSALPYARELGLDVPIITYQGALVRDSRTGEILYHRSLPLETARPLLHWAEEQGYHVNAYVADKLYMARLTPEGRDYGAMARVPVHLVGSLAAWLEEAPTKLIIIHQPKVLEALEPRLREELGEKAHVTRSKPHYLEILHPQATKGAALAALAARYGISQSEVMALGDSYNDLELLEWAGWGVAMANAPRPVQERAQAVTLSNEEDGVAAAVEKYVLSEKKSP